jgi:hypothetical protein
MNKEVRAASNTKPPTAPAAMGPARFCFLTDTRGGPALGSVEEDVEDEEDVCVSEDDDDAADTVLEAKNGVLEVFRGRTSLKGIKPLTLFIRVNSENKAILAAAGRTELSLAQNYRGI